MNIDLDHAFLAVRDVDADGAPSMDGAPWSALVEAGDWYSLRRNDGTVLSAAWRANVIGAEGLFALFGPLATLNAIAAAEPRCMPAREAWERRGEADVRVWLRAWPTWRFDGHVRDDETLSGASVVVNGAVRRLLKSEGQRVPDPTATPAPWRFAPDGTIAANDAGAIYRVGSLLTLKPALHVTLAGLELDVLAENEPPR